VLDAIQHRRAPIPAQELPEAALAGLDRGDLGTEVAYGQLGEAHVALDDLH
jgi:hypothetical protein